MKNEEIKQLITKANNEYRVAMNELYRPAEDMVQMAVCLSVKDLLANYLRAFLLFKNVKMSANSSILQLLKQCRIADGDFNEINLSPVICRAENGDVKEMYCLSSGRIKKCFESAHSVREIVLKKIMTIN